MKYYNHFFKRLNRQINQDISFINGMKFKNFTIEVPRDVYGLLQTSKEMHHNIFQYEDLVISKELQIINLVEEGKRRYTVVVKLKKTKISIIEFKGFYNDASMETSDEGFLYQVNLLLLISLNRNKKNKNNNQ